MTPFTLTDARLARLLARGLALLPRMFPEEVDRQLAGWAPLAVDLVAWANEADAEADRLRKSAPLDSAVCDSGRWLHVHQIAELVEVTEAAVRARAGRLLESGLVRTAPPPGGRGRPCWWFHESAVADWVLERAARQAAA